MISLYSVPMNVNGALKVSGSDALSSPWGPCRSSVPTPNGSKPEIFVSTKNFKPLIIVHGNHNTCATIHSVQ